MAFIIRGLDDGIPATTVISHAGKQLVREAGEF